MFLSPRRFGKSLPTVLRRALRRPLDKLLEGKQ